VFPVSLKITRYPRVMQFFLLEIAADLDSFQSGKFYLVSPTLDPVVNWELLSNLDCLVAQFNLVFAVGKFNSQSFC
jgi:hypothetical protein